MLQGHRVTIGWVRFRIKGLGFFFYETYIHTDIKIYMYIYICATGVLYIALLSVGQALRSSRMT